MKKSVSILLAGLLAAASVSAQTTDNYSGSDPVGTVSYSLPLTTISLEVEAVQEKFHAGPYARFASKYLGMDVRQADEVSYQLTDVKMVPYVEADQTRRYILNPNGKALNATVLKLTSAGLVSSVDETLGVEQAWRFPVVKSENFANKGLSSNLTTESATLYTSRKNGSVYDKVAVRQDMVVEKSLEKKAAETAAMIFNIREKRLQIVTGDTDATFSGEALGAAVEELARLEKEYMTLFTGYSDYQTQKMRFDVVPQRDRESQMYVAFRLSDSVGLLPADNVSGKPVILEIVPEPIAKPEVDKKAEKGNKVLSVVYRIPAACTVKLLSGTQAILQSRIHVYQLGEESTMPVNVN